MVLQENKINTQNDFFFGVWQQQLFPTTPVIIITAQQAYRTAAWIMLMGCILPDEKDSTADFDEIVEAISRT